MRKDEIGRFVNIATLLSGLFQQKTEIEARIKDLTREEKELLAKYGNTGNVYRSGDTYVQSGRPGDYSSLKVIVPVEAD